MTLALAIPTRDGLYVCGDTRLTETRFRDGRTVRYPARKLHQIGPAACVAVAGVVRIGNLFDPAAVVREYAAEHPVEVPGSLRAVGERLRKRFGAALRALPSDRWPSHPLAPNPQLTTLQFHHAEVVGGLCLSSIAQLELLYRPGCGVEFDTAALVTEHRQPWEEAVRVYPSGGMEALLKVPDRPGARDRPDWRRLSQPEGGERLPAAAVGLDEADGFARWLVGACSELDDGIGREVDAAVIGESGFSWLHRSSPEPDAPREQALAVGRRRPPRPGILPPSPGRVG